MNRTPFYWIISGSCALAMILASPAQGAAIQKLRGHVPALSAGLQPAGRLPATNRLHLAISLPLRNREALTNLLHDIYNPASPNFRHYLTPQEFTARFGPTEKDFQAVVAFAKASGFIVTKTHANRVIVDVDASVADIEKAFHVKMHTYAHPSGKRFFYAPDSDPMLELSVPLAHISGLDNASPPQPRVKIDPGAKPSNASPNFGSGVFGSYAGGDFRAAYVPDTTLTGAGQMVGLVQFDGYNLSDITNYEAAYGMTNVLLTNVFLDSFDGTAGANQLEVTLDIEMTVAMAPGLAGVIVYDAGPSGDWHDVLNQMANDNLAQQLSCSWFIPNGPADPVADGIFQQMALQGQSFFDATGDLDAYSGLIPFPGDNPYITQVGGTRLTTTGPLGSRVSEKAWNRGNGIGTAGGISTQYSIPDYQTNVSMANNQGSTTMRNIPDVALTAESVDVFVNGSEFPVGGTSCAAPLWAGFAALVNEQAAAHGHAPLGFANPALTIIGTSTNYALCFDDITNGNNTNASSPMRFFATNGYDLCTGWGTPAGQALINALADPEPLLIQPSQGFAALGSPGGSFNITSQTLVLANRGTNALDWVLTNPAPWLDVSPTSGSLTPGGPAVNVTVSLNSAASNLANGVYSAIVLFTNLNDNFVQGIQYSLTVLLPPAITTQPTNQIVLAGQTAVFSATVSGDPPLTFQWQLNGTNLADGGNVSGSVTNILTISNASTNDAGTYTLVVTNAVGSATSSNAFLVIAPPPPVITQQPMSQRVATNCDTGLSVVAMCQSSPVYQWWKDGVALAGQTNSSVPLNPVQSTDIGTYFVVVDNGFGFSVMSSNAMLSLDHAPVASSNTVERFASGGVRFPVSVLLTNASDADGDPLTLIVSTNSSAGGTVLLQSNCVFYTPPAGYTNSDTFTYTVSDGFCGGMAAGLITVLVQPDTTPSGRYTIQEQLDGSVLLTFMDGIPNRAYRIQYTDSLVNLNWQDLSTQTNDGFGSFQFTDSSPTNSPARYYRAISP
jgi:hypothetical protein